jgi:hypothetical protein
MDPPTHSAVFININLYNPALDFIIALRLTAEFFSSGDVATAVTTTVIDTPTENSQKGLSFCLFVLFVVFGIRTVNEVTDLSFGQAHGMAIVLDKTDWGQSLRSNYAGLMRGNKIVHGKFVLLLASICVISGCSHTHNPPTHSADAAFPQDDDVDENTTMREAECAPAVHL